MIHITPIQTGTAQLKRAQQCGKEGRSALERKIDIFRDTEWVGPVPIFCFLIEHPEGRFLVDTGDTARNSVPGYLPRWNPFFMKEVIIKVAPLEEIGPRLQAMNLDPAMDIKTKARAAQRASEGTVVVTSLVTKNARGAKGPCGGHDGGA